MKNQKLNTLVKVSFLGAMAFVLMLFDVSVPFFPSFLKLDLSDVPALLGAFALGPVSGVVIELLKNVLTGAIKGSESAWIGELANFLVGSAFVFTAGFIYQKNKSRKTAIIGILSGAIAMALVAVVFNYYVLLPFYAKAFNMPINAIVGMANKVNPMVKDLNTLLLWSILPFNLIKGIFIAAVTIPLYKKVSPIFHKEVILDPNVSINKDEKLNRI